MKYQKRLAMILLFRWNVCDQCLSLPLILFPSDRKINPLNVFKAIWNKVVDTNDGNRRRTTTRGGFFFFLNRRFHSIARKKNGIMSLWWPASGGAFASFLQRGLVLITVKARLPGGIGRGRAFRSAASLICFTFSRRHLFLFARAWITRLREARPVSVGSPTTGQERRPPSAPI